MEAVGGFKPPVNVSPLIRFSRWSLLLAGIGYGALKYNRIAAKEKVLREEARIEGERMAPILKAEKLRLQKAELADLEKQVGGPLS
ncbi:ATP synthase subunit e, mitochondrial [Frankliniella occidentalis]|uniref:ATP synthase F(0) complex subunit e, mitochondrial n=1 Tax=Frankliniella occidentalis TaxID=133901 RepID=A0A6J1S548_FRAOC|nr:ATP synthase subunit e, mitochondrial [Frankliniella occidentalis]